MPNGRKISRRCPALTAAVFTVTLVTSVAALGSPAMMNLLSRDLSRLRAGQWWRVGTPVFVQPSGWGQLVFNMVGIAVVGAALQRRIGWASWALIYITGGLGSVAVYSAWHPADTGGGSSAAVAALIGAFLVLVTIDAEVGRLERLAQLYSMFFAVYLTTLDLGGVTASIIAGNATIIVAYIARRAINPAVFARGSLLVVFVASMAMTLARDNHGVGLVIGFAIAALILARRRMLSRPTLRRWPRTALAVGGVVIAALLTWFTWTQLLGVSVVVRQPHGRGSPVSWSSVGECAAAACLAASLALRWLNRHSPARGTQIWIGLCLGVALISLGGPFALAVGSVSTSALISLHVVCAVTILGLLTPALEHDPRTTGTQGASAEVATAAAAAPTPGLPQI